ncbi:hypothetical protein G7066_09080 [Leucobacter coleopterorum]|uniref:Bacteriocin biosynthesis cyclodehydratase domain-containing protein n=1 Tax=Leucobacter coleopterorum TaxID=2714933 RepID=A0ABX6JWU8_9MICO|nr:hypothetical protein [Leucobacter coleopterorum]QIM18722.1 hypothetical protein G7066_09080 [Leucobacter coleopterorum]
MTSAFAKIDTDFPMAWEDLDTLRFGFERAEARVHHPSAGQQRFIASLMRGVDTNKVVAEARRAGVTPREAHTLVADLAPVLRSTNTPITTSSRGTTLRTLLSDDGREVIGFRDALLATKLCTLESKSPAESDASIRGNTVRSTDLVVLVERFLEPLERAQKWLIEECPHLPVRFSDRGIVVGPLIRAGGNPCHTCVTLTLIDADPSLPMLAAQLYGKAPASETEAGAHMAAAWAAVLIRGWRDQDVTVHFTQIDIPITAGVVSGAARIRRVNPHPECACNALNPLSQPP